MTAGRALPAIAQLLGEPVEQVLARGIPVLRELVADGLLCRADGDDTTTW
jgi:hypothetical protein